MSLFPGLKQAGREAKLSHPNNAEATNVGAIPLLSHITS
jgi:hypothetical protein